MCVCVWKRGGGQKNRFSRNVHTHIYITTSGKNTKVNKHRFVRSVFKNKFDRGIYYYTQKYTVHSEKKILNSPARKAYILFAYFILVIKFLEKFKINCAIARFSFYFRIRAEISLKILLYQCSVCEIALVLCMHTQPYIREPQSNNWTADNSRRCWTKSRQIV